MSPVSTVTGHDQSPRVTVTGRDGCSRPGPGVSGAILRRESMDWRLAHQSSRPSIPVVQLSVHRLKRLS
jgi:hypothetical protein